MLDRDRTHYSTIRIIYEKGEVVNGFGKFFSISLFNGVLGGRNPRWMPPGDVFLDYSTRLSSGERRALVGVELHQVLAGANPIYKEISVIFAGPRPDEGYDAGAFAEVVKSCADTVSRDVREKIVDEGRVNKVPFFRDFEDHRGDD
jgi:hypothetical protein